MKPGRNDPCPCGSGRKYKQCCLAAEAAAPRPAQARPAPGPAAPPPAAARLVEAGLAEHQAGRLPAAEDLYRRALAIDPEQADALHLLGLLAHHTDRHAAALDLIDRALARRPAAPDFHNSRGLAAQGAGRTAEAEAAWRQALALMPDFAEAHANLGELLKADGRLDAAALHLERAIALQPGLVAAHHALALLHQAQGRGDQALAGLRTVVALRPAFAPAHSNLGNLLKERGELEAAVDSYRRALALAPELAGAQVNLGHALQDLGEHAAARDCYRAALARAPDLVQAHSSLLLALQYDDSADAGAAAARARAAFAALAERIVCAAPPPAEGAARPAAPIRSAAGAAFAPARAAADAPRRLRIGYVSADLRRHSVAHFIEPVLASHDRRSVEVFCYYDHPRRDAVSARLAALADHWRDCAAWSDAVLAQQIRADRIDILVDLAGHTGSHRLLVFARRPAPLQVAWIGYPASTGLAAIDYQLTDARISPDAAAQRDHVERLYRLPRVFSCYRAPPEALDLDPRVAEARPVERIVLGSFNHGAKLSDAALRTWARLLAALPGARLLLKNHALADGAARARLAARCAALGIAPERLELRGHADGTAQHLAAYRDIDIALDTFPYCGVTTTCEALWMGVPVVTLAGTRFAGRTGASLLGQLGRDEWVAASADAYVAQVVALAAAPARRAALRGELRAALRASPLMDEAGFTRELEAAYRAMWRYAETMQALDAGDAPAAPDALAGGADRVAAPGALQLPA